MDSTGTGHSVHTAPSTPDEEHYDQEAIVEVLRKKRKPRTTKSCFPCRHRKVRCDGLVPCSNCVRRDHASLCRTAGATGVRKTTPQAQGVSERVEVWESPASSLDTSAGQTGINNSSSDVNHVLAQLEKIEQHISSLKSDLRKAPTVKLNAPTSAYSHAHGNNPIKAAEDWTSRIQNSIPAVLSGTHVVELATGATVFLGNRSDPPSVLGCRSTSASGIELDTSGLDQLAPKTYSFASLWAPETSLADVARVLPDDSDMIRYWSVYQACVHPFYPALVTYDDFGARLFSFLDRRQAEQGERGIPGDTPRSWLALLLGVLACGVQFSADPVKERDLRSKVFVCSSFECLRLSNLFNSTDMDQIQAMALIGHCLRNNLDMNTAWIIMGATVRLAQSIGLHIEPNIPSSSSTTTPTERSRRHRLWWMLVWQDSFLSLTYDRPSAVLYIPGNIPVDNPSMMGNSYATSVFKICQVILERQKEEMTTPGKVDSVESLLSYKRQLQAVLEQAQPFLVDKARCTTLQENLERVALHVHIGYLVCRIYRLCLNCEDSTADQTLRDSIASEYLATAAQVVQSFLDMYRLLPAVCRTWAFVHNVASSAIPLKSLAPVSSPLLEDMVQQFGPLVRRLIVVLEAEAKACEWYDADTNVRQYGPCSRVAKALRETYGDT